jgi:tellurite resistance protein TerC
VTLTWITFTAVVLFLLVADLVVFNREARAMTLKEAALWSAVWVGLSMLFNVGLFFWLGSQRALEFLTGYIIEWSLSVDNIFVFAVILSYFAVPAKSQRRVLFWGILGAIIMRGVFILIGAALLKKFDWIIYIFGGILILTGLKLLRNQDEEIDPEKNPVLKLARRFLPLTHHYYDEKFFVRHHKRLLATPLFLVLLVIETTDLVFAVDSVPAIFAVVTSRDAFIIFSSNVCAILGLRSLYFLLAGIMGMFRYLKVGLSIVLCFIGAKMLLHHYIDHYIENHTVFSLLVVCGILGTSIIASVGANKKDAAKNGPTNSANHNNSARATQESVSVTNSSDSDG